MAKHTPEQLSILKEEYKQLDSYYEKLYLEKNKEEEHNADKANTTCPHCYQKDIIPKIRRIQGNLEGSLEGSSSSTLFYGSGSISGSIKGSLDTNEILYCKSCETEWKKKEREYDYKKDALYDMFIDMWYYFDRKKDLEKITFDPEDISEKFDSLEEKKAETQENVQHYFNQPSILRDYHTETIITFLNNNSSDLYSFIEDLSSWPEAKFEEWGCKQFEKPKESQSLKQKKRLSRFVSSIVDLFKN